MSVFAPFISQLRIAVRDPQVRLTWEDIPNSPSTYFIYRYTREISTSNYFLAEQVAQVPPGTQIYIDTPPVNGNYYYAVLAADGSGNPFPVFIPMRNITLVPARISMVMAQNPTPATESTSETGDNGESAAETTPVPEVPARLSGLRVIARSDNLAFEISYQTDSPRRRVSLYRSTGPITNSENLAQALLVDTVGGTINQFIDYPVPGVAYYYGVLDTDALDPGSLVRGTNTLINPVSLPLGEQAVVTSVPVEAANPRALGLPLLSSQARFISTTNLDSPVLPFPSRETEPTDRARQAFDILMAPFPQAPLPEPEVLIFPEDRDPGQEQNKAEARILQSILTTQFQNRNWDESLSLFANLMTLPLETERRARVEFYQAQAQYFLGNYEQSYLAFLLIRDQVGASTVDPWMNDILLRLRQP